MADATLTPETTHFGFTRVASGEAWSKNGWAFSDLDRTKLDQLLYAAFTHTHDGAPALGDPTDPPTLVANASGGSLAAATTYFYRVSFLDDAGLETAASPEASVTTPDPLDPPTAASVTVEATGGTVAAGIYSYLITFVDTYGGETTPSPLSSAQVTGASVGRVRLDMPDFPTGVVSMRVYRSRPGQAQFYLLGFTTSTVFYDIGNVEDQTVVAPTSNTTNASGSVDVTINPQVFIPQGCVSWRIYRATIAGGYDGNSLVHDVTEGESDTSVVPLTVWTDTGDATHPGFPQNLSATVPQGSLLTLNQVQGTLPLAAMARGSQAVCGFAPGAITNSVFLITDSPTDVKPVRLTAYYATPPTDPGVTVTVTAVDRNGQGVALPCSPATAQPGDPAGYFRIQWPLIEDAAFEAEAGTFSGTDVVVDPDPAALSGSAVTLATVDQWVQVSLGVLEVGVYQTYTTLRALTIAASGVNDIRSQVVHANGTVLVGTDYSPVTSTPTPLDAAFFYQEIPGPTFTAPGGEELFLRVMKADSTATTYDVDSMRFVATVPDLVAGRLTFSVAVTGGTSTAANANVALWF